MSLMDGCTSALIGFCLGALFILIGQHAFGFHYSDGIRDGVIAHASGQYTAKLVENPDKTTRWVVEPAQGKE
jgi:hypothetical protein